MRDIKGSIADSPEDYIILHVDDDRAFTDLTADALEREDDRITVLTETNAREGLARLENENIDCIVSDYQMTDMDGLAFLEAVRNRDPDLPFILFTGKGTEEVASDAISKGATDYLKKKPSTNQYTLLANRIRNAVESAEMRQQRNRHLKAIETAQEGIGILNDEGRFIYVNEAYADLYGYDPEEILGEHWEVLYPEGEIQTVRDQVLSTVEEQGSWHGYTTGLRTDGSTFREDHIVAKTQQGDLVCTVSKADEPPDYENTFRKYGELIQSMDDPVFLIDENLVCTFVNDAAVENSPYSREDLIGTGPSGLVEKEMVAEAEQVEKYESLLTQILEGERERASQTIELSLPDGNRITNIRISRVESPTGEVVGALIVSRDITEREQYRQRLEARTEAIEAAIDGSAILDEKGEYRYANQAHAYTYGYDSSDDFIGNTWRMCYDDDEVKRLVEEVVPIVNETGHWRGEAVGTRQDGTTFPQKLSLTRLDRGGMICIVRDITEQKKRERELQETNRQFQAVLDTVDAAIFIKDTEHRYQLMNEECRRLLGVDSDDEICGLTDEDLVPEGVADRFRADDRRVFQTEQSIRVEEEVPTPDVTQTNLTIKSPFYDDDGELLGLCAVSTDITERKKQEQQLQRQNERLDNFASVVSHDLRNPLHVARGRLELVQDECESDHLDPIEGALNRMERIIDDVLWLAREGQDIGTTRPVHLQKTVDTAWTVVADHADNADLVYIDDPETDRFTIEAAVIDFSNYLKTSFGIPSNTAVRT